MQTTTPPSYAAAAAFEHRFWLQIMGDHARFILSGLAPSEAEEISLAQHYADLFDELLTTARGDLNTTPWRRLSEQAAAAVSDLRQFKLHLLRRMLTGHVGLNLSPSLLDHMLNELDEYERLLARLTAGAVPPPAHALHYHLLWLSDQAGHAEAIKSRLDPAEAALVHRTEGFARTFNEFYLKAITLAGFLRTQLDQFPALSRFNHQAELETHVFEAFLQEVLELNLDDAVLSVLAPLLADHMLREACYYIFKLAEVSDVPPPSCDPARPRLQA
jgi:hypothetical protein